MSFRLPTALGAAALLLLSLVPTAVRAADAEADRVVDDPARYGILVSATKTKKPAIEVPNAAVVVKGEQLRQQGARTLADALIDVVGVETGGGTDNGSRLPNIGMWGLKEFDALLITLDGVPVGGPFNPSLAQVSVDDIDRIEIVKGPQGSLYGVSAFAGMVQVFTRHDSSTPYSLTLGGGSWSNFDGRFGYRQSISKDWSLDMALSAGAGDGWQDRTRGEVERGRLSLTGRVGDASVAFDVTGLSDKQDWGTPMPVDAGEPLPGFERTRNYAVKGAIVQHDVVSLSHRVSKPLLPQVRFENTINYTNDTQNSIRSFFADFPDPDTVGSAGVQLKPVERTFFDDARFVTTIDLAGRHEWVTGAAITWGRTTAKGTGFDFDQSLSDPSSIPYWWEVPVGDHRSFEDRRTFFGVYAHDEWTPHAQLTLSGGGRWDHVNEKLHAFGQEEGFDPETADDARTDQAWSGDLAALLRALPVGGRGALSALNFYANWKSSFKPAAPNLTEAEGAHILDPERTHSLEGGVKGSAFAGQLTFDAHTFQMDFHNLVVNTLGAGGTPTLINAGHERFKGYEVSATISPTRLPGFTLSGGYAHHDPRFVTFSFLADPTDPGSLRVVDGKFIELAPRELYNARASYAPAKWLGGWVALRHQGERPLNRRNRFWAPAFDEYDAGLTASLPHAVKVAVTGRNLGDDHHFVSESDIGDSQFYYAPPKRFTAEVTFGF